MGGSRSAPYGIEVVAPSMWGQHLQAALVVRGRAFLCEKIAFISVLQALGMNEIRDVWPEIVLPAVLPQAVSKSMRSKGRPGSIVNISSGMPRMPSKKTVDERFDILKLSVPSHNKAIPASRWEPSWRPTYFFCQQGLPCLFRSFDARFSPAALEFSRKTVSGRNLPDTLVTATHSLISFAR